MSDSMTYNSIDLSGSTYGLTVIAAPIGLLSGPRLAVSDYGGRHGSAVQGTFRGPKRFTVRGRVRGSSRSDLLTKLAAIADVVDPSGGEKLLILDHYSGLAWYALIDGEISLDDESAQTAIVEFPWIVPSGYSVAPSETVQTVTVDESPEGFNAPASGVVAGNLESAPVWKIRNTSGSTVTSVVLTNTTRTETATWSGVLTNNSYLRIDSDRCHVEKSTDGTTWTNAMSGFASGSAFPKLTDGVANACVLTGLTAGTVTITYRARSK